MPTADRVILFDWGDTLMRDLPDQSGPMCNWPNVEALPHAATALTWAKKLGRVGIATSAQESDSLAIRAALARVHLDHYIDFIFCRKEIGCGKTDPRFWQQVLAALKVSPAQVLMIGDSYSGDVLAPHAAGIAAIWFNWQGALPEPCPTITSLEELPRRFC